MTLRHNGQLHHIGIGRTHARTPIILLVADLDIRVILNATTGEILRHLTLDPRPHHDYQPTRRPPGPPPKTTTARHPMRVQAVRDVSRHHSERVTGFEPALSAWEPQPIHATTGDDLLAKAARSASTGQLVTHLWPVRDPGEHSLTSVVRGERAYGGVRVLSGLGVNRTLQVYPERRRPRETRRYQPPWAPLLLR